MKKYLFIFLAVIFLVLAGFAISRQTTTKQCIDYKCQTLTLPLYLKILDFFDRYYNYKLLISRIIVDARTEDEKVLRLFEWTYRDIKRVPQGFKVIDDHIWYTIIRGYGAADQFSDIFTTLCNNAGIKAFFADAYSKDKKHFFTFSFVKIKNHWLLFDPYNGVYFKNKEGRFASIDTLKTGYWQAEALDKVKELDIEYRDYFDNLPYVTNPSLNRASAQSPLNRLFYELKKLAK